MTMPETAVDKNNFAMPWQHNVRLAGQVITVDTKSESKVVKN
jgi:predicted lipoprotein